MSLVNMDENGDALDKLGEAFGNTNYSSEWIKNVKERETLKADLNELNKELNKLKGEKYDSMNRVQVLEKENEKLKQELKGKAYHISKRKPISKRKVPREKKTSPETKVFENSDSLYSAIALKFPDLPLSTVLAAERKFAEADVNNDGVIDANELENILESEHTLIFTKNDVQDILTEIDEDKTNSLDFFECLTVCDRLRANRKTGLPQSIKENKSSVCIIQ